MTAPAATGQRDTDRARLFEPGELTDTDYFALDGETEVAAPAGVTMSTAEVRSYLGLSANDLKRAIARQSVRRVSRDKYLTSSVVRWRRGDETCNLAQACFVLQRPPSWLKANRARLPLVDMTCGATMRLTRESVNLVATSLRRTARTTTTR